jgi:hypothetical protein
VDFDFEILTPVQASEVEEAEIVKCQLNGKKLYKEKNTSYVGQDYDTCLELMNRKSLLTRWKVFIWISRMLSLLLWNLICHSSLQLFLRCARKWGGKFISPSSHFFAFQIKSIEFTKIREKSYAVSTQLALLPGSRETLEQLGRNGRQLDCYKLVAL